jgi:hypothetical protein
MRGVAPIFIALGALAACSVSNIAFGDLRIATFNSAIGQLRAFPLINASCTPLSSGGQEASVIQSGKNQQHRGEEGYQLVNASDHRLVWLDISL